MGELERAGSFHDISSSQEPAALVDGYLTIFFQMF
jgi:hypothetical protein